VGVQKLPPDPQTVALLPNATFADAYRLVIHGPALDPFIAAQRILGRAPNWIGWLTKRRNRIAAPLGLKPARSNRQDERSRIGVFPVISQAPGHVLLGLDDKHLDFRIVIETRKIDAGRSEVMVTTLVRPHNLLGRVYLALVLPFHRIIVRAMLGQAAKA
jgi:Protein of unknown function (DUF2867)